MTAWRHRGFWRQIAATALFLALIAVSQDSSGQEDPVDGADFNARLRGRTKITQKGEGVPPGIRQLTGEFRTGYGLAIFLDRRIDPDAPLYIDLPEMRLEFLIREIALKQKMGVVVRDGYLYLGPPKLCRWWPGELDHLSKQVAKLSGPAQQFWQTESPLKWDEGATPRELAEQIAGDKLPKTEAQRIPHDIWAAFAGPSLPRWEQLAILCAGFDLVPEIRNSGEVALRPLAEGKVQSSVIAVPANAVSDAIENITRYFPDVKASPKPGKLALEGTAGELRAIGAWYAAPPKKSNKSGRKATGPVMALTTPIPVPADKLLQRLAQELKCELVISPDVPRDAVSKPIKPAWNGTRDELLEKISIELDLACEFRDGKIIVSKP